MVAHPLPPFHLPCCGRADYHYDPVEPDDDYANGEEAVRRALGLWSYDEEDDDRGGMGGGAERGVALFMPHEGPAE